jgi:hypothetical protein
MRIMPAIPSPLLLSTCPLSSHPPTNYVIFYVLLSPPSPTPHKGPNNLQSMLLESECKLVYQNFFSFFFMVYPGLSRRVITKGHLPVVLPSVQSHLMPAVLYVNNWQHIQICHTFSFPIRSAPQLLQYLNTPFLFLHSVALCHSTFYRSSTLHLHNLHYTSIV